MIWLIGCKGMLGTEIALQLTENKIDFTGTDIDVDITNPQALAEFVKGKTISYIINCSAYTAVDKAENDAEFAKKLNEDGPRNIANLANRIHAKMIHISTDYVFDGSGKVPYTEDMQTKQIKPYAVDIWNYGLTLDGADMIPVTKEQIVLTLHDDSGKESA